MHYSTLHQIMMIIIIIISGQVHVPAALPPVRILYETKRALVRSRRNGGETDSASARL
jgi:hypothetical protein